MGGGGGGGHKVERQLDHTATWAVAGVCAIIVIISIILEKSLHHLGEYFHKKHKKALFEALEKIKAELMILGFISLLLTFGQLYIISICIPEELADTMLPCNAKPLPHGVAKGNNEHHRRLLSYERRSLSSVAAPDCGQGKVPLISVNGLHQLHIFIFFLAVFHVIYGGITMYLGRMKIRGWKQWEARALGSEDNHGTDASKFRLSHETSFVKGHTSFLAKNPILFYIGCFFRQFYFAVRESDYLTLRHGFISVHLGPGSKFDFQKYIKRSLEDDFKEVVSISPLLWASAVLFLLLNVHRWPVMSLISFLPLIIILIVGTKLQAIIAKMAIEITEKHAVVQGMPLVQVSDENFWFSWPQLILYLIHYVLFQNAFEITYFLWIVYEFGIKSCFHSNFTMAIIRVALGVLVQIICSYITLPLYALVTQMGSQMKRSIFDEQTSKALTKWRVNAAKKKNEGKSTHNHDGKSSPTGSPKQNLMA